MPTEISGSTGVNKIQDNTIVNADINSSAAIAGSKISGGTGKILQVIAVNGTATDFTTTSSSLVQMTDTSISITPTSASSRIYVTWQLSPHITGGGSRTSKIVGYRNSTALNVVHGKRDYADSGTHYYDKTVQGSVFDYPNTTSQVTYSLYASTTNGTFYAHRTWNSDASPRIPQMRIVAMEIEASTQWTS